MKRVLTWMLATLLGISAMQAVRISGHTPDAFQGILPVTDSAMQRSLNGLWQLKVVEGSAEGQAGSLEQTIPEKDNTWGTIPVPGCWEAYGFCQPSYDKARPLTGYYRTTFAVPKAWRGMRIVLRFDGVLYGYDLWVNGRGAGTWRSAYNTALFDITDYINPKARRQELVMRVITQFRGSDFDYNDDWAPCGIFRDVTLMAIPETHLKDLTIKTRNTGQVEVTTDIAHATKGTQVVHEILDAQGNVVGTTKVEHPHLWTAETPYLYILRTRLIQKGRTLQTFHHKFGFRELTIDGNRLLLNGQPVKLRGVTSHATDPNTVKVVSEQLTLKDMRLMKEASVNYIRTSHYPREPRFYELADSLGFYVIDEVPFGYGDKNLSDTTFFPMLQMRAQATIRRDKNHPCVVIWSLGNENPLTDICIRLGHYVKSKLDATRPICYPQVGSYFRRFNYDFPQVADIYTPHYPSTSQLRDFYQRADRPVIFTEYLHTLGTSFEDHDRQWEIIERTPGIAGGSVWEWVDQGMPFRGGKGEGKGEQLFGYEEKVYTSAEGGFEMNGNKGADGLLYADRTPLPNYYELQHNYARASVTDTLLMPQDNRLSLHVRNRFDFINLKDNVSFCWWFTVDRDTLAHGSFSPECAPRAATAYTLCLPTAAIGQIDGHVGMLHLTLTDWQGHTFLSQSIPVGQKPEPQSRLFAGLSQLAASPSVLIQDGPLVRVGRKATMAERIKVADKRLEPYLLHLGSDSPVHASVSTKEEGDGLHYTFAITPDSTRDHFLSELGIGFLLDASIDRVQWIGLGPLPTYPGRFRAGRYGFWSKHKDDLYFEGNHRGVDVAFFTDSLDNGLLLVCQQSDVSFEQTDRGIVVTVNAAVAGLGPKSSRTAFPVTSRSIVAVKGEFHLYLIEANRWPQVLRDLFRPAATVPQPFHPFVTQYDTYLMRYADIMR